MPKIIRILSKDHAPLIYFVKLFRNMHCQGLNMDTFKGDFLNILNFFAPSDSKFSNSCISAKYCPILTNNLSMESLFIQLSDDVNVHI